MYKYLFTIYLRECDISIDGDKLYTQVHNLYILEEIMPY